MDHYIGQDSSKQIIEGGMGGKGEGLWGNKPLKSS
jgi:hypothetical protein